MTFEKHCTLDLKLTLEQVRSLWSDLDDKRRMEVLKSVIWTAPDNHSFYAAAMKELGSSHFLSTLD